MKGAYKTSEYYIFNDFSKDKNKDKDSKYDDEFETKLPELLFKIEDDQCTDTEEKK